MNVRIRCEYPYTDLEPTEVSFTPTPELGASPAEVHARILALLRLSPYIELPVDGGRPMLFWTETRRVVVVR